MEDIMIIRSGFLRNLISKVINKVLAKQTPGVEVQLKDIQVNWSEKDQKIKVHLEVYGEVTKEQLLELLKKADVL